MQLWYSGKGFTGWKILRKVDWGKFNVWQSPAKWEFLRMVDQGNLIPGSLAKYGRI